MDEQLGRRGGAVDVQQAVADLRGEPRRCLLCNLQDPGPEHVANAPLLCPERPLCWNCGKRTGTVRWGDIRRSVMWCEHCALTAQIEHAEERAAALPGLRERLAEIEEAHHA